MMNSQMIIMISVSQWSSCIMEDELSTSNIFKKVKLGWSNESQVVSYGGHGLTLQPGNFRGKPILEAR